MQFEVKLKLSHLSREQCAFPALTSWMSVHFLTLYYPEFTFTEVTYNQSMHFIKPLF